MFCKMCCCKNFAKFLRFFCNFFSQNFCKFFANFLQFFCEIFAKFLQIFCKTFYENILRKKFAKFLQINLGFGHNVPILGSGKNRKKNKKSFKVSTEIWTQDSCMRARCPYHKTREKVIIILKVTLIYHKSRISRGSV